MAKAWPVNHVQALHDENRKAAMVEELKAIEKNLDIGVGWELRQESN